MIDHPSQKCFIAKAFRQAENSTDLCRTSHSTSPSISPSNTTEFSPNGTRSSDTDSGDDRFEFAQSMDDSVSEHPARLVQEIRETLNELSRHKIPQNYRQLQHLYFHLQGRSDHGYKSFQKLCRSFCLKKPFCDSSNQKLYSLMVSDLISRISKWLTQPWNIVDKPVWLTLSKKRELEYKQHNMMIEKMSRTRGLESYALLSEIQIRLQILITELLPTRTAINLTKDIQFLEKELTWIFNIIEELERRKCPEHA
ncbi:uncharacterized protein LOC113383052 [Ctenocephalides felis]|uniref:uncharacterized protein LOC113383052 n=1 Tax=Ctenocephalides felis TaxID=7515 RepID=UPI000E6E1AF3|nr:uncharacterized protein LOC113383052 [Ctenocephalides felis]